jgi:putative flippase GtrA
MRNIHPLKKELIKFTLIGILAVLVDMAVYYSLLNLLPENALGIVGNEPLAKTISFLCGMVVTYSLNKLWTWKQRDRSNKRLAKFAALYGVSLFLNVFTNSATLYILEAYKDIYDVPYKYFIAFIAATGISAVVNFLGQKFWVFRVRG